ncbi:MAG: tRNA 2-selenouridine(34) synthase MnmH [Ferruginibacter sp.]
MAVQRIDLSTFLKKRQWPVFDVRSPGEYNHARIPGAYSLPLFSDAERADVGTRYKQQGKQTAIRYGLDYFGPKMRTIVETVEQILRDQSSADATVLVHCWRGGMRSGAIAWLLDLYGFNVFVLEGGYKAFRNWALQQFEKPVSVNILGGYTGSGKSGILKSLQEKGLPVIDLEAIARHKGSAFGGIQMPDQPSQEMFENELALAIAATEGQPVWLEDESQRIGKLNIPHAYWHSIRKAPVYFLDIPFDQRLAYIIEQYGSLPADKLMEAVQRIEKRLGPNETKSTLRFLSENNIPEAFRILLTYYDRLYSKSLQQRDNLNALLTSISLPRVDASLNASSLLAQIH